ncbi:MAG: AbrB/MazE/SpoVT family DNA-binding domain-containing protein [Rhodocyclaceae bacterium]|nr:AbrB/MazE/SpoVT family DNA-binding domain-containing protein [Rhodocyclaceae bacterium]
METKIVVIGNSQGIRLPKRLLEECHLRVNQAVRVDVDVDRLVISPARKPREGWAAMLADAASEPDLLEGIPVGEAWDD